MCIRDRLGAVTCGYSFYLLLETIGRVDRNVITWSGQGLFWSLILFFLALFILFIPVEFLNVFRIYNATFQDLIFNIIYSIVISLASLMLFQFFITTNTFVMSDISAIGKAVSFSGFIAVPLILFLQHSLRNSLAIIDHMSYSFTLFVWIVSSQIFL